MVSVINDEMEKEDRYKENGRKFMGWIQIGLG